MLQAHPPPRLARSACRTVQFHPSDPLKTAKTITRLTKIEPPNRTISSKTLDFRLFLPARKNFTQHVSLIAATRTPRTRTEPNKPEHQPSPEPTRISRPHPENTHKTCPQRAKSGQIWTNLDTRHHNSQPTTPDPPDLHEIRPPRIHRPTSERHARSLLRQPTPRRAL